LPDGTYTLSVNASGITYADGSTMASNASFSFYSFYGDFTGSAGQQWRPVDFGHYWANTVPQSLWYIDSNLDTQINAATCRRSTSANRDDDLHGRILSGVLASSCCTEGMWRRVGIGRHHNFYYTTSAADPG